MAARSYLEQSEINVRSLRKRTYIPFVSYSTDLHVSHRIVCITDYIAVVSNTTKSFTPRSKLNYGCSNHLVCVATTHPGNTAFQRQKLTATSGSEHRQTPLLHAHKYIRGTSTSTTSEWYLVNWCCYGCHCLLLLLYICTSPRWYCC